MIAITIDDKETTARLVQLASRLKQPVGLAGVLGRECRNILVRHFISKDQREPNQLGGRRQHFWRSVGQSVHEPRVSPDGALVTVSIHHPAIAQKVKGGVIRAKRTNFLTIPVSEDAYGRTTRTFERETGLKLFPLRGGKGRTSSRVLASARAGGIQVEYVLKSQVRQRPDPTALPPSHQLATTLVRRAEVYVNRATNS